MRARVILYTHTLANHWRRLVFRVLENYKNKKNKQTITTTGVGGNVRLVVSVSVVAFAVAASGRLVTSSRSRVTLLRIIRRYDNHRRDPPAVHPPAAAVSRYYIVLYDLWRTSAMMFWKKHVGLEPSAVVVAVMAMVTAAVTSAKIATPPAVSGGARWKVFPDHEHQ